eukprot:CAMPEP_0113972808 /NCGR_PEP_ID=MMETSP0011_2-20120614/13813_1 /TAXON_ID=101924 /ORGANISM="Rhodosorus marinus" /LENGTH=61 /DNA_ID=CAMNT_0000990087 /DNA_START=92 /DNA_END=277 /DNA_ORIENTATION=+ /assembly_acc=CAM_ASM_000156
MTKVTNAHLLVSVASVVDMEFPLRRGFLFFSVEFSSDAETPGDESRDVRETRERSECALGD